MRVLLRSLVLGLVAALALAVATGTPALAQKNVLRAAFTTNPPTLDAILSTTTATRQVAIYLFESLAVIGESYEVIPQLADSWEVSNDGKTYTFKLRRGVKFHNGKPLQAEDVVASYQRFKDSALGKKNMSVVTDIRATNDSTVVFELSKNAPLLGIITVPIPFIAVMPKAIVDKYGQNEVKGADLIGTGPTKFVSWQPDVAIKLARFEDYAVDNRFDGPSGFGGKRVMHFDEVNLIPVTEASARVAGLETGEFDFAESLPLNAYDSLVDNPDIKPAIQKPKWAIMLNVNKTRPWTGKTKFREALSYAIDRKQVMQAITQGKSEFYRVQNSIYYPEQKDWYVEEGQQDYNTQDVAKAKRLLEEVGYNGEEIVYLSNRDYDWMYKASLALTSQWKAAGINVNLQFLDWPSEIQTQRSKDGWDLAQTGWSPRMDPTMQLQTLNGSGDSQASHWYKSDKMNRLMDQVNTGAPHAERFKAWKQVQQLFWTDVPFLRIGDYFELEAVRSSVKGYQPFYVTPRFWGVTKQ